MRRALRRLSARGQEARHITLAMLTHTFLAVTAHHAKKTPHSALTSPPAVTAPQWVWTAQRKF